MGNVNVYVIVADVRWNFCCSTENFHTQKEDVHICGVNHCVIKKLWTSSLTVKNITNKQENLTVLEVLRCKVYDITKVWFK